MASSEIMDQLLVFNLKSHANACAVLQTPFFQAGLRILNIGQDNFDLQEVAYFDIFPNGNNVGFLGSWSNYPYFESVRVMEQLSLI